MIQHSTKAAPDLPRRRALGGARRFIAGGVLLLGCVGQVEEHEQGAADPSPWSDGVSSGPRPAGAAGPAAARPGDGSSFACADVRAIAPTGLARLTKAQYQNTLRDLLGTRVHAQLASAVEQLPDDDFARLVKSGADPYAELHLGLFFSIARQAGYAVSRDDQALLRFGAPCILGDAPPADCLGAFVNRLAERAFRRRPAAEQRDALLRLARAGASARGGLALVVAAVLQSPHFLYRVERGSGPSDLGAGVVELDGHEIAARLSYGLWDTLPDDRLFDLAGRGELRKPEVLAQEVGRMIADPRARAKVKEFFQHWLALEDVPDITRDRRRLGGADPQKLRAEMIAELERFIEHVIWERRGGVGELLTSPASFATGAELARIYGHAPATGGAPAQMGEGRRGLLMKAPLLLAPDGESHPIHRGAFVRARVLCETFPMPDADVTSEGPDIDTLDMRRRHSTRERVTLKTADPNCAGCHGLLNPVGFAFEPFDGVGRSRTHELVYDDAGTVVARHPVDGRATIRGVDGQDLTVASAGELAEHLGRAAAASACAARQIFRFYQARMEREADGCLLQEVQAGAAGPEGSFLRALTRVFASRRTTVARLGEDAR